MEARLFRAAILAAVGASIGAAYRTPNFVVQAPTSEMAEQIGRAAERYRRDLSVEWLGKQMPNWAKPCPIVARIRSGAGGATSFLFDRGEVYGWKMQIQGPLDRILDSVLPHEVTHTIFACHFRQALPRWADEGACTTVEHPSERSKQQRMLISFLKERRGIAFSDMFVMKEYPKDVLPLYSQGYSLARYLIGLGGKRKFLTFLGDGMRDENWPRAIKSHYGHDGLLALQNDWLEWVKQGSPMDRRTTKGDGETLLAKATGRKRRAPDLIYRAQSADVATRDSGKADSRKLVPVRFGKTPSDHRNGGRSKRGALPTSYPLRREEATHHSPNRQDPVATASMTSSFAYPARPEPLVTSTSDLQLPVETDPIGSHGDRPSTEARTLAPRAKPKLQRRKIFEWSHPDAAH